MLIYYGKANLKTKGRVILTNFFSLEESPKEITLSIEEGKGMILVEAVNQNNLNLGKVFKLDAKNSFYLPDWLKEELEAIECEELFFVFEESTGKRYLSPKADNIL